MVAILYPRRLRNLLDVTQPQGTGLPDGGIPVLASSNSSFVIETHGGGGGGGSFSLGASNIGNTLGDTGVTGTRVVLAGIGNLTLSQATDANGGTISISGGTAGAGGVALSASNSLFSTGTVVMSGVGGGATVNTAPGTIQISVAAPVAQSVQTQNRFNLTLDGNTAGALQEVSSGTLTLAGGNGVTLSQNGNAITISGNTFSQSVQPETQTFIGGISASNTLYTSGTVRITGAGNITIASGTGQQVIVSGSQSVQPETQTFVGGVIASNTTYTSGSVRFTGVGGGVTVSSNTGQRVDISVAAQTGTQFSAGLTNSGNTSGDTGTVGGRLLLVGTNNITMSGSTNGASMTITVSGPSVAGAQTGISGIANSQTTYTSGTVSLSELGAITIRSTTGNQFQLSVNAQTGTQFSAGISGGNTSGDTGTVAGRLVLAGGNNITLSGSTNGASETITISAGAAGGFSGGVSNIGNTSGDTGITGSRLVFSGAQSITLSQSTNASGATIAISGASTSQSVQTQGILSAGVSTGGNTLGNTQVSTGSRLVIVGSGMITASQATAAGASTITLNATQSAQTGISGIANSQTTYTSGTVSLSELGAITIRSTTGNQYQFSVNAQTGTQFSAGISGGNTSGDTGTVAGRVVFAGGNNITLSGSTNGVSETISISAFNQTVESQSIGASNLGNTLGTSGVASGGQVRAVIIGTSNITVSQSVNGASATLSLIGQPSFSGGVSNLGNTGGATGVSGTRQVLVGSNNITLSQTTDASGNTVSIFGPSPGAAQYSIGVSTGGNTAGNTGVTGTRIVFVGAGVNTLSQATDATGATITISDTVSAFQLGVSTDGNTAGATGVTGTRMVLVGSSPISLSQTTGANGGTVTINAPATSSLVGASGISISTNGSTISVFPSPRTSFNPFDEVATGTAQQGQGSLHIQPIHLPHVQYDRILLSYQLSNASNSSGSFTLSNWVGIYTKNASTLSLVSSISTSTNFSGSGTAGSYSIYGGLRQLSMPWTMTLADNDYWVGIVSRTTSGGAAGHTLNQIVKSIGATISSNVTAWSGLLGAANGQATVQQQVGLGTYSVSTAGIPNTIGFSEITGTGTLPFNVPLFQFRSGTV